MPTTPPPSDPLAPDAVAAKNAADLAARRERILASQLEPAAFDDALRILGRGTGVDRAYIFRFHPGSEPGEVLCSQLHEWCRPGVVPQIDNPDLQNFCFADVGCRRWFEELSANHAICGDVARFPVEEQPLLLAQVIRSLAVMPIFAHGELWGFLGFDDCVNDHTWTEDIVGCLRVAARVLGTAYERRDYKRANDVLLADYRLLLDSLREVVFRVDCRGGLLFLSPAWRDFAGLDPDACLGRCMADFLHPEAREPWLENVAAAVATGKTVCECELRFLHADGSTRWALGRARMLRDDSGPLGFAGTLTDITAMKATETALIAARAAAEAANVAKSEFLSTMSHELRTPLNAVIGLSESLLDAGPAFDPGRARRYLELIHRGGRQLLDQINDILDLARIEAGQTTPTFAAVPVEAVCAETAALVRSGAAEAGLQLHSHAPSGPLVHADRRMLVQALHNLLSNAVKFTPAGGRIDFEARAVEGRVVFTVRDTGVGIAADKRDRLFKPFSQVDASLSRRFAGTGLGLVLVHHIARLHLGRVGCESTPGAGSTFTLEIPVAPAPASA